MKQALVIRHHIEDDVGLIGMGFRRRGYDLETVMADAEHPAADIGEVDAVVVLGSNQSVYDPAVRTKWLNRELDALARAHDRGVPILGICFGAQILSELFGGSVERSPQPEIGWFEIEVVGDAPLSPGPWLEYHADRCVLPEGATLWARTDVAPQAFTIGRHLGVQFHPEVDHAQLARWFDSQHGESRAYSDDETAFLSETLRQEPGATERADALVEAFLAHALINA